MLIEAKNEQLIDCWFMNCRVARERTKVAGQTCSKAEMLMFQTRNAGFSNACHWHDFQPSPLSTDAGASGRKFLRPDCV
jgi:hypothetical protein